LDRVTWLRAERDRNLRLVIVSYVVFNNEYIGGRAMHEFDPSQVIATLELSGTIEYVRVQSSMQFVINVAMEIWEFLQQSDNI
jgi:hypothetical protein